MYEKNIIFGCKRDKGLADPMCQDNPDVEKIKCKDVEIDGVVYRVWSSFENKVDPVKSLENLMLNKLEVEGENDPELEKSEETEEDQEQDFPALKM